MEKITIKNDNEFKDNSEISQLEIKGLEGFAKDLLHIDPAGYNNGSIDISHSGYYYRFNDGEFDILGTEEDLDTGFFEAPYETFESLRVTKGGVAVVVTLDENENNNYYRIGGKEDVRR